MLRAAIVMFVLAIIAAVFGFTDIASGAAGIAKILFGIFLVLAIIGVVVGAFIGKKALT